MTKDALKLPAWAVPILLSALVAAVVAWAQLGGKEDASAHTADIVRLQGQADSMRFDTQLDRLRDSAWKADVIRILLDVQRQVKAR